MKDLVVDVTGRSYKIGDIAVIGGGPNQRPTRFFSGSGDDPKTLVFIRVTTKKNESEQTAAPALPTKGF